jgi:peptide deformylase
VTERQILRYPHPALKRVARELDLDDAHDAELAERVGRDLLQTMRAAPRCVGLAAPQLDEPVRIVIVDCSEHPRATVHNGLLVLVNPVIVERSGSEVGREGCLSIPHLTANVRRATEIVLEAAEPGAAPRQIRSQGFEARCLQHEIDHLDGILFLDRVDSLARDVFRRKDYG